MDRENIYDDLINAINANNVKKIKELLPAGGSVSRSCLEEIKRWQLTEDIAREMLRNGAYVDVRNKFRETTLNRAVNSGNTELVRLLLENGADVDAINRHGETPLYIATCYGKSEDLLLIKELLKYGADIKRTTKSKDSPLEHAMYYMDCAKLMIKYTLMREIDVNYMDIINLDPYRNDANYSELKRYLVDCVCEIRRMDRHLIKDNLPPLHTILLNNRKPHLLRNKLLAIKLQTCFDDQYPIYSYIIWDMLKPFRDSLDILKRMQTLQMYTKYTGVEGKLVTLDYDSLQNVTQYLNNDDLFNLITAYNGFN